MIVLVFLLLRVLAQNLLSVCPGEIACANDAPDPLTMDGCSGASTFQYVDPRLKYHVELLNTADYSGVLNKV